MINADSLLNSIELKREKNKSYFSKCTPKVGFLFHLDFLTGKCKISCQILYLVGSGQWK